MQSIKVADLASQWLFENGEQTDHKFQRVLYHALQGVKTLNLHALRQVLTARLPVRANKTCALPPDFVDLELVGLVRGTQTITLTTRPRLLRDRAATELVSGPALALDPRRLSDAGLTTAYGQGGGQNAAGHYLLDLVGGQLILDADVPNDAELYLEYLGSGVAVTGATQVPAYAEQAVLSYLDWKMLLKLRSVPQSEKQLALEEHKRQMRLLVKHKSKVTSKDLREATTNSYSLTVR